MDWIDLAQMVVGALIGANIVVWTMVVQAGRPLKKGAKQ